MFDSDEMFLCHQWFVIGSIILESLNMSRVVLTLPLQRQLQIWLKFDSRWRISLFIVPVCNSINQLIRGFAKGVRGCIIIFSIRSVSRISNLCSVPIGHVNWYPTIHYFENPRHTQSMIA